MLFTLAFLATAFSVVEFCGWGPWLERMLDRIRIASLRVMLRNGEIDPKLTHLYERMFGTALFTFFASSILVALLVIPLLLIFGQQATSDMIGSKTIATTTGIIVFGSFGLLVGLIALYLLWCALLTAIAHALSWLNTFPKGKVGTLSFGLGLASFLGDQFLK